MDHPHLAVFLFQSVACTIAVVCLVRWCLLPALDELNRWKRRVQLLGDPVKTSGIGERA